ncbi:MAG TPA: hypothetical protein VFN09_02860 [Rhodanobacteraceae bacterium]|nr:hypothetical protein [Rhodanobacteraceae bacterium]
MMQKFVARGLLAGLILAAGATTAPQVANAAGLLPLGHQRTECVAVPPVWAHTQLCTVYRQFGNGPWQASYSYYLYADGSRSPIFISQDM